jgi:hypothetical protein
MFIQKVWIYCNGNNVKKYAVDKPTNAGSWWRSNTGKPLPNQRLFPDLTPTTTPIEMEMHVV